MPLPLLHRSSPSTTGCLLFAAGIFLFALNDALGKWLMGSYGPAELILVRTIGVGTVLVPLIWRLGGNFRIREQRSLHLLRVVCVAADSFAFYAATRWLSLADVMTFYMAGPLIVTVLAAFVLREEVSFYRWLAVIIGFVGVIVVLQPGSGVLSLPALIALGGAFMFALGVTSTRLLRRADWLPLVTYQFAFSGVVGAVTAPLSWVLPTPADTALMMLVGVVSMVCFVCLTRALLLAPASLLAPIQYTSIIWAILLGAIIWGDRPSPLMLVGNVIIIGSGLLVLLDERRSARVKPVGLRPANSP